MDIQNSCIVLLVADEDVEHMMKSFLGKHELMIRGQESTLYVQRLQATCSQDVLDLGRQSFQDDFFWFQCPLPRVQKTIKKSSMEPLDGAPKEEKLMV